MVKISQWNKEPHFQLIIFFFDVAILSLKLFELLSNTLYMIMCW